jgi:para-nitrobenzyl esterase
MPARKTLETPSGPVTGLLGDGALSFKGIPFARAPVGPLRFAPPEPAETWEKPLKAFNYGPIAQQFFRKGDLLAPPPRSYAMSEDCLSLNIWAPQEAKPGAGLPVFLYLHGGGFSIGSSGQPRFPRGPFGRRLKSMYDGSALAREGIVTVTSNYRLGALGFLSSRETLKRYGTTGNWGLLDQIAALKWVKENIAAFGGDPSMVTLGGESAGGISASALQTSPMARGLFQRLILQSGTVFSLSACPLAKGNLERALAVGGIFLGVFGARDDAAGLEIMRSADAEVITRNSELNFDFTKLTPLAVTPARDGAAVPEDPGGALASGAFAQVPALLGCNADEGSLFVPLGADPRELKSMELNFLGPEAAEAFAGLPGADKLSPGERGRRALGWGLFSAGAKRLADLASRRCPVYAYQYAYRSLPGKILRLGAHHGAEIPAVFSTLPRPKAVMGLSAGRLADDVNSRWAAFIKTGDPNPKGSPSAAAWPRYSEESPMALVFDKEVRAREFPDGESLDRLADAMFGKI